MILDFEAPIYVRLLDEGIPVSRPVQAVEIRPGHLELLRPSGYDAGFQKVIASMTLGESHRQCPKYLRIR